MIIYDTGQVYEYTGPVWDGGEVVHDVVQEVVQESEEE